MFDNALSSHSIPFDERMLNGATVLQVHQSCTASGLN